MKAHLWLLTFLLLTPSFGRAADLATDPISLAAGGTTHHVGCFLTNTSTKAISGATGELIKEPDILVGTLEGPAAAGASSSITTTNPGHYFCRFKLTSKKLKGSIQSFDIGGSTLVIEPAR